LGKAEIYFPNVLTPSGHGYIGILVYANPEVGRTSNTLYWGSAKRSVLDLENMCESRPSETDIALKRKFNFETSEELSLQDYDQEIFYNTFQEYLKNACGVDILPTPTPDQSKGLAHRCPLEYAISLRVLGDYLRYHGM
jgi:hypothetical protein